MEYKSIGISTIEGLKLKDGSVYTGPVIDSTNGNHGKYAHGMGVAKYSDHNVLGRYEFGNQNGPAYINYHDWMWAGYCVDNKLEGWGIYIKLGECHYGIFEGGKLRVDLTNLVKIVWNKILEMSRTFNFRMVSVLKDKEEVFIGYPEIAFYGKMGFHFTNTDYDYIGAHEVGHSNDLTGTFIRIDKINNKVIIGKFENSELVQTVDKVVFADAAELWVNYEFCDFEINESFSPEHYGLSGYHFYKIFEIGNIPGYIIAKAYRYNVYKDNNKERFELSHDVRWFKFSNTPDMMDKLFQLKNGSNPWVPYMADYCVEFINNIQGAGTSHLPVLKHISCEDADAVFEFDCYDKVDYSKVSYTLEYDDLPF